jgi:hypothetical protein
MNFKELLRDHPDVTKDRYALSFSRVARPADIAAAYSEFGVVRLREALPPGILAAEGEVLRRSLRARRSPTAGEAHGAYSGSWHPPWSLSEGGRFPAAAVIAAVIRSWVWDVVENLCASSHVVLLLKWCTVRHAIDKPLGVGGHQDAKVVAEDVPFSLWIPFNPIVPGQNSGLGFVVPAPDCLLPTQRHQDFGADYLLEDPLKLWIPSYEIGDLTIHSRFSPHFTTGYGTETERISLEIRPMSRRAAPPKYLDPSASVSRRQGIPTIVDIQRSADVDVDAFLGSADLSRVM